MPDDAPLGASGGLEPWNRLYVPPPSALGMETSDWKRVFEKFFAGNVPMTSSYKPVLLCTLTDAAYYCSGKEPAGYKWIEFDGSKIRLGLDFIAARFALYYWEVYPFFFKHMAQEDSDKDKPRYYPEIMKIIRDNFQIHEIPNLTKLQDVGMKEVRQKIINTAITPEVLPNLLHDIPDLYEIGPGSNQITLDATLAEYMNSDQDYLRDEIQHMLDEYVKSRNIMPMHILPVENPFFLYVRNRLNDKQRKLPNMR